MTIQKEDPHTIKDGEIQITSNANIEAIVTDCSSPEVPKDFYEYNPGAPSYPINFYNTYYAPDNQYTISGEKVSSKLPLWIYVNSMYDAGYKADDAKKFIETQCNTIKNNITETFKNIQSFSKPEVDTICNKWPIDDSYLIKKSIRGSFIFTYILQQLFVEGMLEWNSIMSKQVTKICDLSTASDSNGDPYSAYGAKADGKIKPSFLIKAGWFDSNTTEFSYDTANIEAVSKSLGCLQPEFATEIVNKYINGDLGSINITKDTMQSQLVKTATSNEDTNIYSECTEHNKKLVEKVKDDLYGTTFSTGSLEKEIDVLITEIEGTFWSQTEVAQKQQEFRNKCEELGFKVTNAGEISPSDKGTQISGLEYEVDDSSENYAKQLLKGVEDGGGFIPQFGIVGNYDGLSAPATKNTNTTQIITEGIGANEAYIDETNAQNAVNNGYSTWAQFKTTTVDNVLKDGYGDKKENYVYGTENTPIKKKSNGLVDWQNQETFNITSENTYPYGDTNFIQKLQKDLISIQRKKAEAENKGIGSDFELIYGDSNSNPTYYIGPLSCYDCILKNYYETFGYNGMPKSVKNSDKYITNRLNKLFNDFSKSINTYLTSSGSSPYDNRIDESCPAIFKRVKDKEQPVFVDNIFDGIFIGNDTSKAILTTTPIKDIVSDNCPNEKTIFSLLVYWLGAKFPMDNIQFWTNDTHGEATGLKSIFFTEVADWIKYDILDTLQKWGRAFNQKAESFNIIIGTEAFNDLICSPAGILIASSYANETLAYANENTQEIKDNIMKILNMLSVINILEKIIIKNLDIASINKYVVYKLIELAEGTVKFVNPPKEETTDDNVVATDIKEDLRQPARNFSAKNSIGISDYNWGPTYNLEHTKINPNAFSRLILWEFQPAAVTPTKVLVGAAEQLGANEVNKILSSSSSDNEKIAQGINNNNLEKFKTTLNKNDKSVAAVTRLTGSAIVNTELNSLANSNSQEKENKVLGIDWIKNKLPGKWVGRYEIPFFNNHFMKTKTKDSWSMGNALNDVGGMIGSIRDGFQYNVQDVPVWDFNKDPQEGINWSTSFFLINDNIGNVKKNISFLMSFAAGSYWLQINGYQYHCPNLYRVECPGRFFELYTSLDILVQYYGKTRKILKSEAKIFDDTYKFKLFNELLNNNQLFIPEAYEVKIDSKSLQPNAFNIQYNYFIRGAANLRPDGNICEDASGNFDAANADNLYSNPSTTAKTSNENIQNIFVSEAKNGQQ